MNVPRLILLALWAHATTLVVACGADGSEGSKRGAPDAGAGGMEGGGAATSTGGAATSTGGATAGATGGSAAGATGGATAGATGGATATSPDSGPAIECSGQGGSCIDVGEACCSGLVCVAWKNPPRSGCEKACGGPGDCSSGCCLPLANSNTSFCAAAEACRCAPLDATCGGSARCCAGFECTSFDATGAFACKPTCQENRDCASGCCAPLTGTSASVCLGKEWCGK